MQKYINSGEVINYENGGTAVTSGDVVIIGSIAGVALGDIAANETGSVLVEGVVSLAKATGITISQGDELYWSVSNSNVTKTATDKPLGVAFSSEGTNDTTVYVKLAGNGNGTATAAAVAAHGSTTNLPASNVTLTTAGGNTYSDADVKAAIDSGVDALKTAVETRLDNAEAKTDAIILALKNAGIMAQ